MSDFNPALPKNITWRVGKNKGPDADRKPNRCTLFIPAESMQALVGHLMAMVDTATNATTGEVYDWETKQKVTVPGFYLTGKGIGREGEDWGLGELTIAKIEDARISETSNRIPRKLFSFVCGCKRLVFELEYSLHLYK